MSEISFAVDFRLRRELSRTPTVVWKMINPGFSPKSLWLKPLVSIFFSYPSAKADGKGYRLFYQAQSFVSRLIAWIVKVYFIKKHFGLTGVSQKKGSPAQHK